MAALAHRDYVGMLDCISELHACATLERFPGTALTEILKLVGADSATFNYVAPSVPKVETVALPALPDQESRTRRFAQYLPQHGPLNHFLATGDPGAFKLSDFHSERAYHALPLYQEFYRELQYEDQMTFMLFPLGAELIGVSLARNRRSFTERDREVLNLMHPHIGRAYRHVERVALLNRALRRPEAVPTAMRVTSILLDAAHRSIQFGGAAQQWISHFFPDRPKNASRLPSAVADWLRHCGPSPKDGRSSIRPNETMVREVGGERLRMSIFPGIRGAWGMLVLSLETVAPRAQALRPNELTHREIQVLLEVEQGKTNGEVSAALGISPLTVRCHLEHIFEKLHVPSRTAAVTQFRRQCIEHSADDHQGGI